MIVRFPLCELKMMIFFTKVGMVSGMDVLVLYMWGSFLVYITLFLIWGVHLYFEILNRKLE